MKDGISTQPECRSTRMTITTDRLLGGKRILVIEDDSYLAG